MAARRKAARREAAPKDEGTLKEPAPKTPGSDQVALFVVGGLRQKLSDLYEKTGIMPRLSVLNAWLDEVEQRLAGD